MNRFSIKIGAMSGQGVDTVGKILARALKNTGFNVFGYREYPSLIKGGNASYQIDFSDGEINSSKKEVDVCVILTEQHTKWYLDEIKNGGIIIHDIKRVRFTEAESKLLKEKNISFIYIPATELSTKVGGNYMMSNIVVLGYLWKLLHLPLNVLAETVLDNFKSKVEVGRINALVLREGFSFVPVSFTNYKFRLHPMGFDKVEFSPLDMERLNTFFPTFNLHENNRAKLLISGNEAVALGAISSGVRVFFGYPMTPSSGILTYLAAKSHATRMVVKQVEDEITAIGSTIGAMFGGTRALTATSGGGFDLMTEHISLSGITEVPLVVVVGQRPGPATGLPTWTTQADLMLALHAGHGEFPRIVIAPSDPEDIYYKLQEAFNISEKYQVPVIFLTDKLLAESLYLTNTFDENRVSIERYLVTEEKENLHRYEDTENGVSPRWNPGTLKTTYVANSDEHDIDGNVIEDSEGAIKMQEKRHRKVEFILKDLPEPEVIKKNEVGDGSKYKIGLIGWGSTKGVMKDVVGSMEGVAALSYTYVFPLKVDTLKSFIDKCEKVVLIEGNFNSQLGDLIKLETGIDIKDKILKYDGRPFFLDEVIKKLND